MPLPTSLKRKLIQNLPETAFKSAAVLPQSTTEVIFTISGGPIVMQSLTGIVTVVLTATTNTLAFSLTPLSSSGNVAIATASTTIASDAVDTIYKMPAAVNGQLVAVGALAAEEINMARGWVMVPGDVILTTTGNTVTGQFEWYMTWLALLPLADVLAGT